jgi:CDP-diacylglycerol---serine O-phosphatidyltransferase
MKTAKPVTIDTERPTVEASAFLRALPNLFTLAALASGMSAIMFSIDGQFGAAIGFLILAMLLDACDGRVARLVGTSSKFGAELDSLSDVICFGAAPALLLYQWGLADRPVVGWLVCVIFTAATAVRLARFNVLTTQPDKPVWSAAFFQGVPSPAGAFLSLLPFYLAKAQILPATESQTFALFWVLGVAGLMVSTIPTFSGKLVGRVLSRAWALMAAIGLILSCTIMAQGLWHGLVVAVVGYAALVPLSIWRFRVLSSRS